MGFFDFINKADDFVGMPGAGEFLGEFTGYSAGKRQEEAAKAANETNLALGRENIALQREFAKHGIRWRVEDAAAAGIHPLAAIGAPGASFSPVSMFVEPTAVDKYAGMRQMGQNILLPMLRAASADERIASRLRLEHMGLENELLRSQISSINNVNNPPMPVGGSDNFMGGQGDSGVMLVKPSERTASAPGRLAQEAGWRPDVGYSRTDSGMVPVIPQGLSESLEDDLVGQILWRIRNQVMPNITGGGSPPRNQLPRGATDWRWDKFKQEWQPFFPSRRSFGREVWEKFRYGR